MKKKTVTRRDFLKQTGGGSVALTALAPAISAGSLIDSSPDGFNRQAFFAAMGDTLIPTDPRDPGYRSLERYGITTEIMKGLAAIADTDLIAFNRASERFFRRTFLRLAEARRARFLRLVISGDRFEDGEELRLLRRVYRQTRTRVFTVYYQNFPENVIQRDENGVPVLRPGDRHQITNPNTNRIATGWDVAGYRGQMTWEEEEERRKRFRELTWK